MSPPVFLAEPGSIDGAQVVLDGDEGRHAAVVRRMQVGEPINVTDGRGRMAACLITAVSRDDVTCDVQSVVDVPAAVPRVVVAQALAKGDRGERAVETLTEVGVDEILPWSAARCVTRWKGDRGNKALRKWRSTAREASKQARRAWLPDVGEQVTTPALATRAKSAALTVVLHEEADAPISDVSKPLTRDVLIVVGPEGGIAEDELAAFGEAGAQTVRLGPSVLRTSTAGTVAAGIILSRTPRW